MFVCVNVKTVLLCKSIFPIINALESFKKDLIAITFYSFNSNKTSHNIRKGLQLKSIFFYKTNVI